MSWRLAQNIVLVGVLLSAAPGAACAQGKRTVLGFEFGYSRAKFSPSALSDAREGSLIGGFVGQRLSGPVSAQIELLFNTKGGTLTAATGPASVQAVYVELPLLLRAALPVGRRLRPVLLGGGSYALSVGCEFRTPGSGALIQDRCDQAGTGLELTGSDVSAIAGGALEYLWRGSTVRLEVRRFIGLRTVVEGGQGRTRAWVALLGITF